MINAEFFTHNRTKLLKETNESLVVLTGYDAMQLTADAAAPFHQEANFWYLTGIEDPGWRVMITRDTSTLLGPEVSDIHKVFDGGLSDEQAMAISGADAVVRGADAEKLLDSAVRDHSRVASLGDDPNAPYYSFIVNPAPGRTWSRLRELSEDVVDIRKALLRQRAIKHPHEIAAIRELVDLTMRAFSDVRQKLQSYSYEYEIEAEFTSWFRRHNAHHAYEPIVAGGINACTLHYNANTSELQSGEVVLLDIGAMANGYSADITRTYAVGTPTTRQKEVHQGVSEAMRGIIDILRPGVSLQEFQDVSDEKMKEALRALGLLRTPDLCRTYFPHAIGHGLGVDVHDSFGGYSALTEGMVLTVEPGIYIPEEGIGVRIEDNILITASGHENLSASLAIDL